jgi:hypothetical protein
MTDTGDRVKRLYPFERASGAKDVQHRRTVARAREVLAVLCVRLGVPHEGLDERLDGLLVSYCTEVILNIEWYDEARRREQRANAWLTTLMVIVMGVALGLIGWSALSNAIQDGGARATMPLVLFAGGALTALQVMGALGDRKARLALFWKAGADLKEGLYTFEHAWGGGKGLVSGHGPTAAKDEFVAALDEQLRSARAIARAERLEFFATIRSPSDVAAVALSGADSLRARRRS